MITCLILPAMAAGMERNSPTVFKAALQDMQFWDGRTKDVEQQAGRHVMNPVERASRIRASWLIDRAASRHSIKKR